MKSYRFIHEYDPYVRATNYHTTFWLENFKGRGHLGDLGVNGRIILKLIKGNKI
jgi:hypothetical protein